MKMPAASSSTSAANSSLGTSAQPAFKRFKFLSEKLSQSAACRRQHKQRQLLCFCSRPDPGVCQRAAFHTARWRCSVLLAEMSGIVVTCGSTGRGPAVCPSISIRLMSSGSSLSLWLSDMAERRNRLTRNLELGVFLKMNGTARWRCSVFLSETSGIVVTSGSTGRGPSVCPSIWGLCRAGLLCLCGCLT